VNSKKIIQGKNKRPVESIRNEEDLKRIRSIIYEKPRDLLLFDLATQTGIRMKELLSLKVNHIIGLKIGDGISISGSNAGNPDLIMNKIIHETFRKYLKEVSPKADDYLFKSRKKQGPLSLSSVSNMIKRWFEAANIEGPYGARSLRKTWEYFMRNKSHPELNSSEKIDFMEFIEPVEKLTVQEQIYKKLSEAIISGRIPPGAKLTTAEISKRFNVSATPVRWALNWLEARGFAISQKKKAIIVKELSVANLKEITTIRLALETFAAKLSCKNCSEETLISLESLLKIYEETNDLEEFQQTNKQFHQTLYRDSNMFLLQQLISDLCDKVSPYFVLFISNMDTTRYYRELNLDCHRKILEGMRRKDPEEVCKWLNVDMIQGIARMEAVLERKGSVGSPDSNIP
jgi:DNA-binding GntR family transcriptional regulator